MSAAPDTAPDSGRPRSPVVRQDIEILRIVSAFGIVWFHSGFDGTGISYSGLVVFLILSSYLAAERREPPAQVGQILSRRALRLLSPWAVWMVAYGIRNHFTGRNLVETDRGWINGILAGTNIHLWYLPYMFAAMVAIDLVLPRIRRPWLGAAGAIGAVSLLSTAELWRPWSETYGYPTVQYLHAVSGILIGLFLACAKDMDVFWRRSMSGLVLAACLVAFFRRVEWIGIPYLTGTVLCGWILLWPLRLPAKFDARSISGCMFGVYLSHIFFDRFYFTLPWLPHLVQPLLTFSTALLLTWLLRRFLPKFARFAV